MAKRKVKANYDLLSGFDHYVPSYKGIFYILLWFLFGALLGNVIAVPFLFFLPAETAQEYAMVVSYPVMFIPPMMYARYKSSRNEMFESGVAMDSNNFGKLGGAVLGLLVVVATLAAGFMTDLIGAVMPDVPDSLQKMFESLTGGNFFLNFLCVSIFAPFFEEWLCRGEVLRGLLNNKVSPTKSIIFSAVFFAVIHLNPWQAVPAFILGCLFGYVYYKTGSLKLTMLMHFTNNTLALILGQIDSLKEMENWLDVMPVPVYVGVFVLCAIYLYAFAKVVKSIPLQRVEGNCDVIDVEQ